MGLFFAKTKYIPKYDSINSLTEYPYLSHFEWMYDEDEIRARITDSSKRAGQPFDKFFDISPEKLIELCRKYKAEQQTAQEQKQTQQVQKTTPKNTTLDPGDVEIAPGVILTAEQYKNMQDFMREVHDESMKKQNKQQITQTPAEKKDSQNSPAKQEDEYWIDTYKRKMAEANKDEQVFIAKFREKYCKNLPDLGLENIIGFKVLPDEYILAARSFVENGPTQADADRIKYFRDSARERNPAIDRATDLQIFIIQYHFDKDQREYFERIKREKEQQAAQEQNMATQTPAKQQETKKVSTADIDIPDEVFAQFQEQLKQRQEERLKQQKEAEKYKPNLYLNPHGKPYPTDDEFKIMLQQFNQLNMEHRKILRQMKDIVDKAKNEYDVDMTLQDPLNKEISEQIFTKD